MASHGSSLFDAYRALGLFSMDKNLQWAHVYGASMELEGIKNGTYIAYEENIKNLMPADIVLSEISDDTNNPSLDGGLRLIKFTSFCNTNAFFNAIIYNEDGNIQITVENFSSVRGRVLFKN